MFKEPTWILRKFAENVEIFLLFNGFKKLNKTYIMLGIFVRAQKGMGPFRKHLFPFLSVN
jgi:hypothetical protein